MMTLSDRDRQELERALGTIESVVTLAGRNFPGNTRLRFETCGGDPKATCEFSATDMRMVTRLLRAALAQEADDGR